MARHIRLFGQGALLALFWLSLNPPAVRAAETIRLNPGFVSLVKLDQTISTIVIGNPDIVDATLQGRNTILLTAKRTIGSAETNVIVLDPQDAEIFNAMIVVGSQGNSKTEIHGKGRAADVHEYWAYRCMPTCERVEDKLETFQRSSIPATAPPTVVTPPPPSESSPESGTNQPSP